MEKLNYKKEIIFWVLLIVPFVYLAVVWNSLPERVPVHFGMNGQPNGWGSKSAELIVPVTNIFIYLLLVFIPLIDPKKANYEFFKTIYYKIRLVIIIFMSAVCLLVINIGVTGRNINGHWIVAAMFLLFAVLGNFMVNIKSNWFVGVRTPWTLSSDMVWEKTHLIFGRIWFYGGILCFALCFVISDKMLTGLLLTFIIGSVLYAFAYSYWLYKKEEKTKIQ